MTADYNVKIRVRNNLLLRAMRANGYETVAALSRASGLSQTIIGHLLNLKVSPLAEDGEIRESVTRLAEFLCCHPLDLFPEQHWRKVLPFNTAEVELTQEDMITFVAQQNRPLLADASIERDEATKLLEVIINKLPKNRQFVVRERIMGGKKLEEVAKMMGVTRERIRQHEVRAIRQMRKHIQSHPGVKAILLPLMVGN